MTTTKPKNVARQSLVIQGYLDDEGEMLFWSNQDGWVSLATATVFAGPPSSMPIGATHVVGLPEA